MLNLFLLLIEDNGDKEKFEYIYKKYSKDMYKVAFKYTENTANAEEIVSEAFLSVLDNIKIVKTDNEISLKAYLFRIVKNKYYDFIKKENNSPIELQNVCNIAEETNPEDFLEEKEEVEIITKIILKMPNIYRYVFYFKYNENYSIHNIASLFDLSEGTVRKILKEGVKQVILTLRKIDKYGKF